MILRSKFKEIQANPALLHLPAKRNVKFYFDEKDAYAQCPKGYSAVVSQWELFLDDATDDEIVSLKKAAEDRIIAAEQESIRLYGVNYVNDAQRRLIRRLYNRITIYSCWYLSDEERMNDLLNAL